VPGRIRYVRYGPPAFEALAAAVDALKREDPTLPITVVVPSARAARSLRHRLAARPRPDGRRGLVNLRCLVAAELAEEFGGPACRLGGRRPLTRAALGAAARAALRDRPTFLAAVAEHASTEQELVDVYKDVRQLGADGIARLSAIGPRSRELSALCAAMRERMATGWFDDVDLVDAAVDEIGRARHGGAWGHLVVHLPESLRPADERLLVAVGGGCDLLVHLGLVADGAADAPVRRLGDKLRAAGFGLEGDGTADAAESDPDGPVPVGESVEAPDAESETRGAIRLVVEHLVAGGAPEGVALLYTARDPYCRLLAGAFAEAGISWNGPSPDRIADSSTARVLRGLVELASTGLERAAVMAWLRSAPLQQADGRPVPVGEWDRASRLAGITGGDGAEWCRHLVALAEECRRALGGEDQFDDEVPTGGARARTDGLRRTLAAAVSLGEFVTELDAICRQAGALRSWSGFAEWSRGALARYLGARQTDPTAEGPDHHVASAVNDTLGELAVLDGVDARPDLARFARALAGVLDHVAPPTGRLSSGIMVGPLEAAAGIGLDLAVVLGCVEGELPRRARASGVLSAEEREEVGLEAASPSGAVERDRRRLLVAVSGARRVVLARRDRDARDGRTRIRSRFIGRDVPVRLLPSPAGALDSVASGALAAIGEGELVTATLVARARGRSPSFLVGSSPRLTAGSLVVAARSAPRFTRFQGLVGAGAGVEGLVGDVLSPTTLEEFAVCPFRYFLGHELRCEVVDPPERRVEIDPRDRGQIAHEVLERYMREMIGRSEALDADPAGGAARLAEIGAEVCDRFERLGRTGKRVLWARTRRELLARLEAERARDAEARSRRHSAPIAVEWLFGTVTVPAVDISVGDRSLRFRGKVDRVDRRADGSLDVIDYKTGKASSYQGIERDPVDGGRHLQLPIYALAVRDSLAEQGPPVAVRASFRFLDEPGDEVVVELDAGTVDRTNEVLEVLAGTVDAGCFPCRPGAARQGTFEHCSWCDFDPVCPADRDALWREARAAPTLAGYVGLVEPGVPDA
jgi:RecB family exonuclease